MLKPQIVSINQGYHNNDLVAARARLVQEGTWKPQRVIMLIPAADSIPAKVYLSHCSLIFPPNQPVHRMLAVGMEVGFAYSSAIEAILEHPSLSNWEYLLTIEHDNIPSNDALLKLIARMEQRPEFAAISGCYFTKGSGGCAQIWGDIRDPVVNFRPQPPSATNELIECYGIGMGLALWRLSMFKDQRIKRPLFATAASKEGVGTQDLAFWSEARKYGYRCAVDCEVKVGHYDMQGNFGIPDFTW